MYGFFYIFAWFIHSLNSKAMSFKTRSGWSLIRVARSYHRKGGYYRHFYIVLRKFKYSK